MSTTTMHTIDLPAVTWATSKHVHEEGATWAREADQVPCSIPDFAETPPQPESVRVEVRDRVDFTDHGTIVVERTQPLVFVGASLAFTPAEARRLAAAITEVVAAVEASS